MTTRILLAAGMFFVAAIAAKAEDTPEEVLSLDVSEGWTLKGYVFGASRQFSHCLIQANYKARTAHLRRLMRGDEMWLTVKANNRGFLAVGMVSSDWRLTEGRKYKVDFIFSNGQRFTAPLKAYTAHFLEIWTKDEDNWSEHFIKAKNVEIKINNKSLGLYPLNGSAKAMKALIGCTVEFQKTAGNRGGRGGGTFERDDTRKSSDTFLSGDTFDARPEVKHENSF